jgi:hypothetical protein
MAEGLDEFPFRWIAQDLRRGRCIPFLGAGASAFPKDLHAKPPGARALALELAEESRYPAYQVAFEAAIPTDPTTNERILRAKVDCENLMLVSSWVEHGTGDRPRLRSKLRAYLANEQQPLPCNSLHALLARVAKQRPMAIMTTNYDDLIELALIERNAPFDLCVVAIDRPGTAAARRRAAGSLPRSQSDGVILFKPAEQDELKPVTANRELLDIEDDAGEVRLRRTALFKIHGHISRTRENDDTFVMTEEDYVSFLGGMDSLIPWDFANLMQSRTLLFLGYSLRDWNFRVLLDRVNRKRDQRIKSYAIAHDVDATESRLWEKRNVTVYNADLNEFVPRLDAELASMKSSSI